MTISVFKLVTMTEAELGKLTKAELIAAIKQDCWQVGHYKTKSEDLQKTLDQNQTDERAACIVLAAFVGQPMVRNEYHGTIESKALNILELAGLATAKAVSVAMAVSNKN